MAAKAKRIRNQEGPGESPEAPANLHDLRREGQAQLPLRDDTVRAGAKVGGGARPRRAIRRYCTTVCQRIDWRDRGHRKACKKIRDERAAEAARAEAPPSPPKEVYGPAPRSHADEVRARIAAEHEAARARREANPEPEPAKSERWGSRCPICMEDWDVNAQDVLRVCCCRTVCRSCEDKIGTGACPLCRLPCAENEAENLARLRRHVENEVPEAISYLGDAYSDGDLGLPKSAKNSVLPAVTIFESY